MATRAPHPPRFPRLLAASLLLACAPLASHAQLTPAANAAFDAYTQAVERRIARQRASANSVLDPIASADGARLRPDEVVLNPVEETTAPNSTAATGTMLQHWRGTAFVAGARAPAFDHLLRDVAAYPRHFAPEVLQARLLASNNNRIEAAMRIRQHHVLTVTLDASYDITFSPTDAHHGWSTSRSRRIAEIAQPDTPNEHPLGPADEHGFLYRLNTYWTWEERDGGLYVQIETVSLSRAIPQGLGWALKPYVTSVPRDSLTFTLRSACNVIRDGNK